MSKILLIDDEEANVRVLSMSLRSDGYEVVTALSGKEGLEIFQREEPEIVLTDIKMPGMDGIEVLQGIKALQPDAEVIIITGHGDIDNAIEALKFGASDFINKPIRDEVLSVALDRAMEKRSMKRQLKAYTLNLEMKVSAATQEIRRKSKFLAMLIRSANDGIIATDKDMTIVIYNPEAERIFGYPYDEVVHHCKITEILPDSILPVFGQSPRPNLKGSELARMEIMIQSKEQEMIPVYFYATPLFEKTEMVGTVSFFQDLREIKRLEYELVRAERLAAIGQTVAGVAHGVKNILHGFKGGSYLVELGIGKGNEEKLKRGWDMIQRNIGRTSDLVMDLLSYSKERDPQYEPCDPNAIIEDVCEIMHNLAKENNIALVTELDASIESVIMDPHTIHQCISNLISNAIDACLFDEDTSKAWRVAVQSSYEKDRYLCIRIVDNGMGMSTAVKNQIFTSFFSTKGHRGTGLGLMVTRKSVEEHGGTIEVESKEGQGTTFTLRLPFNRTDAHDKGVDQQTHVTAI
ncbi:MAG: response regulator [Desulfobacteraceae bacterium]|jgi:PAS domain S-box-containing protein